MIKKKLNLNFPLIISILLFLCCFRFGLLLAEHKPLWNDEIYTQVGTVVGQSYADMFLGKIGEGNNCPLFYVMQKVICDLTRYKTPKPWFNAKWGHEDRFSQIFLRINPVFFMSLSIVCIFYYFSRFYSLFAGLYSLFISLSSFMVWNYLAEARPYALWVFLTTIQSLIFLYLLRRGRDYAKAWPALVTVHFLLSLTVVFSVAQIFIVSVLLWFFLEKNWKKYILSALIPIAIGLFYYAGAPKYPFWFDLTPEQIIRDCFSRDRFYILFIFMFFLTAYFLQQKTSILKLFKDNFLLNGVPYLCLTVLMLLAAFLILFIF